MILSQTRVEQMKNTNQVVYSPKNWKSIFCKDTQFLPVHVGLGMGQRGIVFIAIFYNTRDRRSKQRSCLGWIGVMRA